MKRYVHTTIKMSLASVIAIVIAQTLGLEYAITAGILAVLSIQLTKKDSVYLAIKRFIDALIALALFTVFFVLLGYTVWVFVVVTVLFIALSFLANVHEGIVPSLVLASHLLLQGQYDLSLVFNGFLLITIAVLVAMVLNILYPLNSHKSLQSFTSEIDALIVKDLQFLADVLKDIKHGNNILNQHHTLKTKLSSILKDAELIDKDILFDQDHRHMHYLRMRYAQMKRIDRMYKLSLRIHYQHPHANILSDYIKDLSEDIGHADKATYQLNQLEKLLETYRKKPLPETRDAFETRAVLYQMMFELETFLKEKLDFHAKYQNASQ